MFRLVNLALLVLSLTIAPQIAHAQERSWSLDGNEEDLFLTFGVVATDDVGISFWCKTHSGVVSIFLPNAYSDLPVDAKAKVSLIAGDVKFDHVGTIGAPMADEKKTIEAQVPSNDPLLLALQNADVMTIQTGNHNTLYPLLGADFAGLITGCEK